MPATRWHLQTPESQNARVVLRGPDKQTYLLGTCLDVCTVPYLNVASEDPTTERGLWKINFTV